MENLIILFNREDDKIVFNSIAKVRKTDDLWTISSGINKDMPLSLYTQIIDPTRELIFNTHGRYRIENPELMLFGLYYLVPDNFYERLRNNKLEDENQIINALAAYGYITEFSYDRNKKNEVVMRKTGEPHIYENVSREDVNKMIR